MRKQKCDIGESFQTKTFFRLVEHHAAVSVWVISVMCSHTIKTNVYFMIFGLLLTLSGCKENLI